MNILTPEQEKIIVHKWTEPAFSWEYRDTKKDGIYVCRRCEQPLFDSATKFDSWCGWPSFDEHFAWAVDWTTDADGRRTEITCHRCGGHLGHVFIWEHATQKNTRHCVNSLSIKLLPRFDVPTYQTATLGGGCFWCIEWALRAVPGVIDVYAWYSWWSRDHPTYERVSTWSSWYIEVAQVIFDPNIVWYADLLINFFMIHDPTTFDKQWHDEWEQYRSVIFWHTQEQLQAAHQVITKLQPWYSSKIVTEIREFERFWIAEDYHQHYFERNAHKPYCQMIVKPKFDKIQNKYWNQKYST